MTPTALAGGEVVAVYGTAYDGGCAYACRFGEADDMNATTAAGSYRAADGGVRCLAPHMPAGSAASLWLTLNGQQYHDTGANVTWA